MLTQTPSQNKKFPCKYNLVYWGWFGLLMILGIMLLSSCQYSLDKVLLDKDLNISTGQPYPTIVRVTEKGVTATLAPNQLSSSNNSPATLPFSLVEAAKISIYSEGFNTNWMILGAENEDINPRTTNPVHNGLFSIDITPNKADSQIFLIVRDSTDESYPRAQIHGFRLWLNPGNNPLALSDLAVGILGSNNKYEFPNPKNPAALPQSPIFTQVYIYAPNADPVFPANTWTEMVIWLDSLGDPPQYDYIMGFTIQRRDTFRKTFFIDDIQLILTGSGQLPIQKPATATASQTPFLSATPTPTNTPTNTPAAPRYTPTPTPTEKVEKTKAPPPKDTEVPPPTEDPFEPPPTAEPP